MQMRLRQPNRQLRQRAPRAWMVFLLCLMTLHGANVWAIDTDGDSIDDNVDNCTNISNIEQRDTDGDGLNLP